MPEKSQKDVLKLVTDIDNQLIVTKIENFKRKYNVIQQIGKGAFGTVHTCQEKTTGVIYAVKIIDKIALANKNSEALALLKNEIVTI